jgi:hypothetical protein
LVREVDMLGLRQAPLGEVLFERCDIPAANVCPDKADTARPAVVLGHKCEKCGLIVSEDSRKKEKVGGKSPDSVAKAKCPKCKQKMGNHQLRGFPDKPAL